MTERGIVVSVEGEKARVRVGTPAACSGCGLHDSCSTATKPDRLVTVRNPVGAIDGDLVEFETSPGQVVTASLLIWVVPIIALIAGYSAGVKLGGAVAGFSIGFGVLALTFGGIALIDRTLARGSIFFPIISRILSREGN